MTQTQPKTGRNVVLAGVIGLVIGFALAFLAEALDTRVRTGEEIADRLGARYSGGCRLRRSAYGPRTTW